MRAEKLISRDLRKRKRPLLAGFDCKKTLPRKDVSKKRFRQVAGKRRNKYNLRLTFDRPVKDPLRHISNLPDHKGDRLSTISQFGELQHTTAVVTPGRGSVPFGGPVLPAAVVFEGTYGNQVLT